MKKEQRPSSEFQSLTSVHRAMGYPDPKHPLIALINGCIARVETSAFESPHVLYFYKISLKTPKSGQMRYGQHYYDFDNGGLFFAAPGQVVGPAGDNDDREKINASMNSRYTLLIHPDFFLGHPLAKKIKQFGFFSYSVNEALNLSDEEAEAITSVFRMIDTELSNRLDDFSEEVIISQIELLLNFSNRFYKRQFITRKSDSHDLLEKLDDILNRFFNDDSLVQH
ncbi:MAG: AraC family transcriptional regulator, partial [Flavitalea sp.]